MSRPTLKELDRRCQKPEHRRIGNWMARRITRPAALRVTWVVAPWGITANAATVAAWAAALAAAIAFGWGTAVGWLLAAGSLQLFYLLDHVDGQLARLRGTASLDGVQLDYLMHHTVNLLVPIGVGWGLFVQSAQPWWLLVGTVWGVSLLLITLVHDTRYKAFFQRLKRLQGELQVVGGGGGRPQPQPPLPRGPLRSAAWSARKLCEGHTVMNMLSAAALAQLLLGDASLLIGRLLSVLAASMALTVAVATMIRSHRGGQSEREFSQWFRLPEGSQLAYRDGWWHVDAFKNEEDAGFREKLSVKRRQSP